MKQFFLRSIQPLLPLNLKWKGFLLTFLFLFPALALFGGEDLSQVEGLPRLSPLFDSVPGPSIPPAEAAQGIKDTQKPPPETKSPPALEKRARRAADRYTLSNKTFFQHILARHGPASTVPGKSRFVKGFDVRAGIDYVLKSPDARIRENTEGRRGFLFEITYRTRIGISPERKPLRTMRVVIDEAGRVVTAFPVK